MNMKKGTYSKIVAGWTLVLSTLLVLASLMGLFDPHVYAQETKNWAAQGMGQDIGNLIAAIVLVVSGYFTAKGSTKASLIWLGTVFYLMYAYTIYAMALHFNVLFLVYVAIMGFSFYGILVSISHAGISAITPGGKAPRKLVGLTLLAISAIFELLWLSEIVPALAEGRIPQSVKDTGLLVNPVHVLDLAIVLPGLALTGYFVLKGNGTGYFFATPLLTFIALMGSSIIALMITMSMNGFPTTALPIAMVSTLVALSLFAMWRLIRTIV
ncbi:MAG: hypothetical protein ABI036_12930 [Fibrobacteria bacterium]